MRQSRAHRLDELAFFEPGGAVESKVTQGRDGEAAPSRVTALLSAQAGGSASAADELLPLVYDELRALAQSRMAREPAGQTIQATALVHEVYLRLVGDEPEGARWANRAHFFAAAAQGMRRILVERARGRARLRHGGGLARVELQESAIASAEAEPEVLALDSALTRLEAAEPRKARVVLLRHFAGLSIEDTAAALDLSPATVKSDWAFARAWLHRELSREPA